MIRALVMIPGEPAEVREIDGSDNGDGLREIIGGWLEGVGPMALSDAAVFGYADEEGRLKGLPVNEPATMLARVLGWPGDFLVGPIVFVGLKWGSPEDGAQSADIPSDLEAMVTGEF